MKPERSLIAERPLAQHCAEVLGVRGGGQAHVDALPSLARVTDKIGRAISAGLAPLLGVAPTISGTPASESDPAALLASTPALAANSLLAAGAHAAQILVSVDAAAILRIVDRTFGGRGEAPSPMPESFPLSAEIMIRKIEAIIAAGLADVLPLGGLEPVRRSGSLTVLEPFADATPLAVQTLTVEEPGNPSWQIVIALPMATLGALFGQGAGYAARPAVPPRIANATEEPFGDLPLTLSAVIVDMRMAMSALAALKPGSILPVSVARNVPLRVGDKTIAHGSIGSLDDRVAIQILQAF